METGQWRSVELVNCSPFNPIHVLPWCVQCLLSCEQLSLSLAPEYISLYVGITMFCPALTNLHGKYFALVITRQLSHLKNLSISTFPQHLEKYNVSSCQTLVQPSLFSAQSLGEQLVLCERKNSQSDHSIPRPRFQVYLKDVESGQQKIILRGKSPMIAWFKAEKFGPLA